MLPLTPAGRRQLDSARPPAMVEADRPAAFWERIQSRTCSGRMSIIRIAPELGHQVFADHVGVTLAGRGLICCAGSQVVST